MVVAKQRVLIGVDGQHAVAVDDLARRVLPLLPETGDAHHAAVGTGEAGRDGFARAPVGFINSRCWNDAVLGLAPGVTEGRFFGDGLGAGVVGVARQFLILGPGREQAEDPWEQFEVVIGVIDRGAHEGALVAGPEVQLES